VTIAEVVFLVQACPLLTIALLTLVLLTGAMVHSASYWRIRCITDTSSDEENTPPNMQPVRPEDRVCSANAESPVSEESTGTATPSWLPPQHGVRLPRRVTNPPPDDAPATSPTAMLTSTRAPRNPTTSSPVLLETHPASPPRPRSQLRDRRTSRQERRAAAGPYSQRRGQRSHHGSPSVNPRELMRTSPVLPPSVRRGATRPQDRFCRRPRRIA
jgi:hypothetical protein